MGVIYYDLEITMTWNHKRVEEAKGVNMWLSLITVLVKRLDLC